MSVWKIKKWIFPSALGFCLLTWAGPTFEQQLMDTYDTYTTLRSRANDAANRGSFSDALEEEQAALKSAEDVYGPYHPKTLQALCDLGAIYRAMGRYQEAENIYKWVLAVREKTLESDDPLIAESLNNLAALYGDLGRDREAEIEAERALQIVQAKNPDSDQGCVMELLQLGKIQMNLQEFSAAEKNFGQAVSLYESNSNNNPVLFLESLFSLAQVNRAFDHNSQAETQFKKAMAFCDKQYKSEGVQTADALEHLGDFYKSLNQGEKAKAYYESALKIYKPFASTACTYPAIPFILKAAACLQANGDEATAHKLREEVLIALKESLGSDHPRVAVCLADLAANNLAQGKKLDAIKELRDSLAILKNSLGANHPLTLSVQKRLAEINKEN